MITADLTTLKGYIGTKSDDDDQLLADSLTTASQWVLERVYPTSIDADPVQTAIVMLAARLFQRRRSPEGVAGFSGDGVVVRVLAADPDIRSLLERHQDMFNVGVG